MEDMRPKASKEQPIGHPTKSLKGTYGYRHAVTPGDGGSTGQYAGGDALADALVDVVGPLLHRLARRAVELGSVGHPPRW